MRYLLTLITIVSLVTVGCEDRQQSQTSRQPSAASQLAQQRPKLQEPIIPDDVSYSIIDSSTLPGIKRSLDVRLSKKVSERTLRAIALKLKSQDSRDYDRTFIHTIFRGWPSARWLGQQPISTRISKCVSSA